MSTTGFGHMQRHQPTDSQIEKPDPIAMESQEEDSTIPKENSTVQEEDSTVQKEDSTVQGEDSIVQKEDLTVQKEDRTDLPATVSPIAEQLTALLERSVLKLDKNLESLTSRPPSRLSVKSLFRDAKTASFKLRPPSSQDKYQQFLAKFQE